MFTIDNNNIDVMFEKFRSSCKIHVKIVVKNLKEKPILNVINVNIYGWARLRSDFVFKQLETALNNVICRALVIVTVSVFTFLSLFSRPT